MNRKLLLLTGILFAHLCTLAQARRNFHYRDTIYTITIDTPRAGKTHFEICNQKDTCRSSPELLWPFQRDIFQHQFKTLLHAIDSTLTKTSDAEKSTIIDSLVDWYNKQFISKPLSPTATVRAGLSAAAGKPSDATKIGVLILNRNSVLVGGSNGKIKEVHLTIENGVIARRALYVLMEDGRIFFNQRAPINFPGLFRRRHDSLSTWQGDGTASISLKQVINYLPFGKLYYPEDREIVLLPEDGKDRDTLTVSSSLNNILEVNVYTDLLGTLGDKPNGLIQTEIAGHFVSNTGNLSNKDVTLHHFMRPYLRLSRFDSKFRSLDSTRIRKGPKADTLDRTYMTQITYLQAGLKMNLIKFGLGINQLIYLNIGGDVNLVSADSVYRKDLTYFNYYGELNYTITRLKNFGMDASVKWSWQLLSAANNDIIKIANKERQSFFSPMFNLYYYPTSDASSRIYFRFAYFANSKEGRSNYSQFQVGYRTSLKM